MLSGFIIVFEKFVYHKSHSEQVFSQIVNTVTTGRRISCAVLGQEHVGLSIDNISVLAEDVPHGAAAQGANLGRG